MRAPARNLQSGTSPQIAEKFRRKTRWGLSSIGFWWAGIGFSWAIAGCSAGFPPPSQDGAGRGTLGAAPEEAPWSESLDEALFGAPCEPPDKRPGAPAAARAGPSSWSVDARASAQRAEKAVLEGRLEDAVPLLRELTDKVPEGERWMVQRALGDALFGLCSYREAAQQYLEATRGASRARAASIHGNLAMAYLRLGAEGLSRAAAEKALDLEPGYPEALKTIGLLLVEEGRKVKGAQLLEDALRLKPDIPEALLALAELDEEMGRPRAAAARYAELLSLYRRAEPTDHHRRWRNLFYPRTCSTAEEIESRLRRLESPGDPDLASPPSGKEVERKS
jgi:tetratricopeptide (TPR) repeat protein